MTILATVTPTPNNVCVRGINTTLIAESGTVMAAGAGFTLPLGMSVHEQRNFYIYEKDLRGTDLVWWSVYAAKFDGHIHLSTKAFDKRHYSKIVGLLVMDKHEIRDKLNLNRVTASTVSSLSADLNERLGLLSLQGDFDYDRNTIGIADGVIDDLIEDLA